MGTMVAQDILIKHRLQCAKCHNKLHSRSGLASCDAKEHRNAVTPEEARIMSISRQNITDGAKGLPIISRVVVHGDVVYLCGVTPDPVGDIRTQTKQVLERIDRLLESAGTDKSKLLTAQVWLADMRLFADHNAAWNEWVDPRNPPARACVRAELFRPNMLVEIMVTATK